MKTVKSIMWYGLIAAGTFGFFIYVAMSEPVKVDSSEIMFCEKIEAMIEETAKSDEQLGTTTPYAYRISTSSQQYKRCQEIGAIM